MKQVLVLLAGVTLFSSSYSQTNFVNQENVNNQSINIEPVPLLHTQKLFTPKKFLWLKPILSVPTDDKIYIDFVGTGDIQKTISEGKAIEANTGLGIVFERFHDLYKRFQSLEFEAYLNIFTTADTIVGTVDGGALTNRRNFSSYLLNPISARQSTYINTNIYFGYPLKKDVTPEKDVPTGKEMKGFGRFAKIVSGINARFIASNNVWQIGDTVRNLGGLYGRIGIFHELIPDNYRLNENFRSRYSCFFGINYTYRGLFGDLSSMSNTDVRKRFLGTDRKGFSGIEFDFGFRLNNIRAEFQMPIIGEKKSPIEGLTNAQFLFSIKFVGGFGLKLNEGPSAPPEHSSGE